MQEVVAAIVRDEQTGLFGFRLEMGRSRDGRRVQAKRKDFPTYLAALGEYRRLCAHREAGRTGDTETKTSHGPATRSEQSADQAQRQP